MNLAELHRSHDKAHTQYRGLDTYQTLAVRGWLRTKLPKSRGRVLDIGCADGYILSPFCKDHEVIGVDVSPQFAPHALKSGFASHQIKDLSSDPLDIGTASVDLVFCGQTIEHVIDTDWLLSEINRVLKPGGTVMITTPNVRSLHSVARWLVNESPAFGSKYRSGHVRDWTTRLLRRAIENNGFQVEKMEGVEFWLPNSSDLLSPLFKHLPSLATAMLAVGRKVADVSYQVRPFEN